MSMLGPDALRSIAAGALETPGADGVEVVVLHERTGLSRFADGIIHQNLQWEDGGARLQCPFEIGLRVRVVRDGRVGLATTNQLTPQAAARTAARAAALATASAPDPGFAGFATPADVVADGARFDPATATAGVDDRLRLVRDLAGTDPSFPAAGIAETTSTEIAIATSAGQYAYDTWTKAAISSLVRSPEAGTGFAEQIAGRLSALDARRVGELARHKAETSANPITLEPGTYEVVLEPPAVATLVAHFGTLAIGGRYRLDGRSWTTANPRAVLSPLVTIWDDATSAETVGAAVDVEGTPKARTLLVEGGRIVGATHDQVTGHEAGVASTGHAALLDAPLGPIPLNPFMAPGATPQADLVAGVRRGLLVTRFHYTNIVDPAAGLITGMTRNGTWLIENGEVVAPIRNLRFHQSIPDALSAVIAVGTETGLHSGGFDLWPLCRVPALRIGAFRFTGLGD